MGNVEGLADTGIKVAAHEPLHIDSLITLGLAAVNGDTPAITAKGRKVLVRGSSLLLQDLAA